MTGSYFPWWLGAMSLAIVTVGCCIVARRPLGVSGILARFVNLRGELRAERQRRAAAADCAALEAALLAATADAFGTPAGASAGLGAAPPAAPAADLTGPGVKRARGCAECAAPDARPSLGSHAVFLGAIVLGGLVVQLARGGWSVTLDMGPTFASLFGTGPASALALAAGGVLVGIGTSVSGGCSTGHGLSTCSRLQPAGVAATIAFGATAVVVSFLLAGSLR